MTQISNKFGIPFAAALLVCGNIGSVNGIEATAEGSAIDLGAQQLSKQAELVRPDAGEVSVRVTGAAGKNQTLHLFDLEELMIDSDGYAIIGEVRYDGVEGDGYLEMWNHMPAEKGGTDVAQSFFSRTMGISGPLGKITGDSDWRAFQLPAYINDGSGRRPLKLTLNVVLPGEGTVEVRGLKLQELPMPRTFNLGAGMSPVVISLLSVVLGAVLVVLFWILRKKRADSELRRIQALDS